MIDYSLHDRLLKGVKVYGFDSEFMQEYHSLRAQLSCDVVINDFFNKWKIPECVSSVFFMVLFSATASIPLRSKIPITVTNKIFFIVSYLRL